MISCCAQYRCGWMAPVMVAGFLTSAAMGQHAPRLTPVDPGVGDRHPLSVSLREIEVGLQHPIGFDRVYRMPGMDDHFVRASGGLYAVFPQSAYAQTRFGEIPLIPAGTVFHIGDPTLSLYGPPADSPGLGSDLTRYARPLGVRLDGRIEVEEVEPWQPPPISPEQRDDRSRSVLRSVHPSTNDVSPWPDAEPIDAPGTIIGDERYRQERVRGLLRMAVEAERNGTL